MVKELDVGQGGRAVVEDTAGDAVEGKALPHHAVREGGTWFHDAGDASEQIVRSTIGPPANQRWRTVVDRTAERD